MVQFRLPVWRKERPADQSVSPDDVLWGVKRKMGHDAVDDPWAHRGRTQHAYYLGRDTMALCGYRPSRWRRSTAVPLAAPTELNPHCRTCQAAVAFIATALPGGTMMVAVPVWGGRTELPWPEPSLVPAARKVAARKVAAPKLAAAKVAARTPTSASRPSSSGKAERHQSALSAQAKLVRPAGEPYAPNLVVGVRR